jgi:hydrogenase maturation protein HypF
MCAACRAEYEDPANRRFHAQPNACPECGPSLSIPLSTILNSLLDGAILAIKGLGGYHLACRCDDEAVVAALRQRKHREDKPFALMAPDLAAARRLVELGPAEEDLLMGRARPIVIARRRPDARVAPSVAPGSPDLGVMLPYTPLHHLLLHDVGRPLVMTSGNVSDEPIAYQDGEARERLGGIADLFLTHDRPIHMRTDDSVVRATSRGPLMLRRSRGYVPDSVTLPVPAARPILAYGAELKSTFCVAKGRRAWVSHHIGDLENWETLRSFREGVDHFERLFAVEPEVVAHDLHPDYLSTKEALEREGVEHVGVQHHHAHLAACLADHGEVGPAVGAIFDGTGYGPDGTVWGGELLVGGLDGFERTGWLWPVRMPGGARAIREPWRMACAWLAAATDGEPDLPRTIRVERSRWKAVADLARSGLASPATTSMGRLFDAVAALCGMRAAVNYEGQAAAELEGIADRAEEGAYPLPLLSAASTPADQRDPLPPPARDPRFVLDARETIAAILRDLSAGPALVSARFHNAVAASTAKACARIAENRGLETAVLSGGVFQNRLLLERTAAALERHGLRVLVPRRLPPNDGGISYGQAAVAAALLDEGALPSTG